MATSHLYAGLIPVCFLKTKLIPSIGNSEDLEGLERLIGFKIKQEEIRKKVEQDNGEKK